MAFWIGCSSASSAGTPSTRLRPMALSTGRVRFRTRACSSTASRARVRDGGLRLTTQAGGPSTTGTQNLSSTCPRGPVELVSLRCVSMPESCARPQQLSVMSVAVAQAASATHTRAGERGVQARHGQFCMMCSSAIVPATPTSAKPCRIPATTRSWWASLYRTRRSCASSSWHQKDTVVGQETLAQSGGVEESYKFSISDCRGDSDLGLRSSWHLAQKNAAAQWVDLYYPSFVPRPLSKKHVNIINSSVTAVRIYKGDGLEDEIELSLPFVLILQSGRIWHRLHLKFQFWQSRCVCGPCDWNRPTRNTFTIRNQCPVWCSSFYSWHCPYYGPYCRPTLDNGWCSWRLAIVYSVNWQ